MSSRPAGSPREETVVNLTDEGDAHDEENSHEYYNHEDQEDHTTDDVTTEPEESRAPLVPVGPLGKHSIWTAPKPLQPGDPFNFAWFVKEANEWRRLDALRSASSGSASMQEGALRMQQDLSVRGGHRLRPLQHMEKSSSKNETKQRRKTPTRGTLRSSTSGTWIGGQWK